MSLVQVCPGEEKPFGCPCDADKNTREKTSPMSSQKRFDAHSPLPTMEGITGW